MLGSSFGAPYSTLTRAGSSGLLWTSSLWCSKRAVLVSGSIVDHPPHSFRRQHTYRTLPLHDANRFGGRSAYLREIGPFDHKRRGRLFKRNSALSQWNVDVWCAQQTLRKKWKGRDWVVMELPFLSSPKLLQRVIPEIYTDLPTSSEDLNPVEENKSDHNTEGEVVLPNTSSSSCSSSSRYSNQLVAAKEKAYTSPYKYRPPQDDRFHRFQTKNIRHKVFDIEEIQSILFGGDPRGNRCPYPSIANVDSSALTLEKFL